MLFVSSMASRSVRLLLGFLLAGPALAVVFVPREARAQAVTVNPLIVRQRPDGTSYPLRAANLKPEGINFQDCEDDINLVFNLLITMPNTSYTLEAWAGSADCTLLASRTAATAACWPVLAGGIPQSNPATAVIRARDIAAHITDAMKPVTYTPAGEEACHKQTASGATAVSLYFFFTQQTRDPVGTPAPAVAVPVATLGPSPPSNVSVQFGDTLLIANWTAPNDQAALAYNVFCDPPRGQEEAGVGAADDAGGSFQSMCADAATSSADAADAAEGADGDAAMSADANMTPVDAACPQVYVPNVSDAAASTCPSKVLVSGGGTATSTSTGSEAGAMTTTTIVGGVQKAIDHKYLCGSANGGISSGVTITGLQNGVFYTLAVAGTDAFGNNGPLSTPGCKTPQLIDDFWNVYRRDGGGAGGGFCALEGVGIPAGTTVFTVGMLAAMVALVRRRAPRSRDARRGQDKGAR